jgi:hypothetical protein
METKNMKTSLKLNSLSYRPEPPLPPYLLG